MTLQWKNKKITKILEAIALIVFISFIPLLFLLEEGTSLIWTVFIPVVPVALLIIGFSNWRNICPLAFFSKISQRLNWIQKRKVPRWFENNFYNIQFFILYIALSLRLTTLNFDGFALGMFFILVILTAFALNMVYTGKSWCNFFCPVGVVERIYTLSNAKNYNTNSACQSCTACKMNCPDIDMESNYWKESANKEKSFAFYGFSGLILGFYLYFYLQSGSFAYYFSGVWATAELTLLTEGFYFAKYIPVVIAAPLTLALFSFASYFLFSSLETFLWKKKIFKNSDYATLRHQLRVLAAFVAFNIFYIFAGAPAYMHYPTLYAIFYFIVVVTSTVLFYKEIFRKENFFIQERFALKMIRKWDSNKPIPTNLKEIYYTYINENKDKEKRLETYKETIKDLMNEGILDEESMVVLEKLREQIGISAKDHEEVIKNIKAQHGELFDNSVEKSSEKRYQRNSYKKMIENALEEHIELTPEYIKSMQKQFCISDELHKSIMDSIFNTNEKLRTNVIQILDELSKLLRLQTKVFNDGSREISFLKYVINIELMALSKDLFALLFVMYKDNKETLNLLMQIFKRQHSDEGFQFTSETLNFMDKEIASKILIIKEAFDSPDDGAFEADNIEILQELLLHKNIEIATGALLVCGVDPVRYLAHNNLDRFVLSKDDNINALAHKILYKTSEITIYEKMMHLNAVPIFENIKLQELKLLASSTKTIHYQPDEYIIKQGSAGDKLFIIINGSASVEINGKQTNVLTDKDYFGEIAILGDITRTASIKAIDDLTALTISKNEFKEFLLENPKASTELIKGVIKKLVANQEH